MRSGLGRVFLGFQGMALLTAGLIAAPPARDDGPKQLVADPKLVYNLALDDDQRKRMMDGREPIQGQEQRDLLDRFAIHLTYRLTMDRVQNYSQLVNEAHRAIFYTEEGKRTLELKEEQQAYMEVFAPILIKRAKEVLEKGTTIAQINAARILAGLGKTGPESVGATLREILDDKNQSDAVKLYAIQGLRDLFSEDRVKYENRRDDGRLRDNKLEAQCIESLYDFLTRTCELPKDAPREELDAFRFLRREAVRALGNARLPSVDQRLIAFELLKIMTATEIQPEPSMSERVEAAIALCRLQAKFDPRNDYQPQYAAYFIAKLAVEMAGAYSKDPLSEPWEYYAARLLVALDKLKEQNVKSEAIELVLPVLKAMEPKGRLPNLNDIDSRLKGMKPAGSLFKKNDKSVLITK